MRGYGGTVAPLLNARFEARLGTEEQRTAIDRFLADTVQRRLREQRQRIGIDAKRLVVVGGQRQRFIEMGWRNIGIAFNLIALSPTFEGNDTQGVERLFQPRKFPL